jgi:hypothetical protein
MPAPVASITADKSTGPAPFKVFFDCTGTTSADFDAFKQLDYRVDFAGDGPTGYEEAKGPVVSHLFETPGTYVITLEVRDLNGLYSSDNVIITVDDPDTHYSGTNTVCVSTSGTFDHGLTGTTNVTSSDFTAVMNAHWGAGKRILFRGGETFTAESQINSLAGGAQSLISSWGASKATVTSSASFTSGDNALMVVSGTNVHFDSLSFTMGLTNRDFMKVGLGVATQDFAISSCDFSGYSHVVLGDMSQPDYLSAGATIAGTSVYYCTVTNHDGEYQYFIAGERIQFVGNTLADLGLRTQQHPLRCDWLKKAFIAQNTFGDGKVGGNVVKIHAAQRTAAYGTYSEEINFWKNTVNSTSCDWVVQFGPQNGTSDERLRKVIVDSNYVSIGGGQIAILCQGADMVARNNITVKKVIGTPFFTGVICNQRGIEPAPTGFEAYNNNCYSGVAITNATCVRVDNHSGTAQAKNNAVYAPAATSSVNVVAGTNYSAGGNLDDPTNPLWTDPANDDFSLQASSPLKGLGLATVPVLSAYNGGLRDTTDPDAGAWEDSPTAYPPAGGIGMPLTNPPRRGTSLQSGRGPGKQSFSPYFAAQPPD